MKLRSISVKKFFTIGRSVKTIKQCNDLIGLESNCRLKKLTDSNAHNTIKRKYFESAILKYAIHSDFSLSLFVFWVDSRKGICLKESLKAVLLYNGNEYPSIPVAHVTNIEECYDVIQLLLEKIDYTLP